MKKYFKGITMLAVILLPLLLVVPLTLNVSAQEDEAVLSNWLRYDMPPLGNWNPFSPRNILGLGERTVCEPLALYLFGNGTWIPWLATSWSLDPETKNFTVNLRHGVMWHNLEEFTSKDVQCTFYLGYLMKWTVWEYLDQVYAVDPYTVVFHFDKIPVVYETLVLQQNIAPYSVWAEFSDQTIRAIGAGNTTGINDLTTALLDFRPPMESVIGTGPFKLTSISPEEVVLEKFLVYWRASYVHFDKMVLKCAISDEISRNIFTAGIINSWTTVLPATVREVWDATPNLVTWPMPSMPGYGGVRWNMFKSPTNIKEVREAMTWALNRTIYTMLGRPGEFPPRSPLSIVPTAHLETYCAPEFLAKLSQYDGPEGYPFGGNYEKAKEILDEAGIIDRDGDGIRETKDGVPLEITMAGVIEFGYIKMINVWVSEMAKIGIKIIPHMVNLAGYLDQYNNLAMDSPDKDHAIVTMWGVCGIHPWEILNFHVLGDRSGLEINAGWKKGILDPEIVTVPDWVTQPWGPSPGEVNITQAVIDLGSALDITEQKKLVQIIAWYANEYVPWSPNTFGGWWTAYNLEEIEGWPADIPDRDDPLKCDPLWTSYPIMGMGTEVFLAAMGLLKPRIAPPVISYVTIWITKDVSVFSGADGKIYGPFSAGTSTSLPKQDADRLVKEGRVSFSPPLAPGLLEAVNATLAATLRMETAINTLSGEFETAINTISTQLAPLSALSSLLYAVIALQVIVLIIVVVVASIVRRRPPA